MQNHFLSIEFYFSDISITNKCFLHNLWWIIYLCPYLVLLQYYQSAVTGHTLASCIPKEVQSYLKYEIWTDSDGKDYYFRFIKMNAIGCCLFQTNTQCFRMSAVLRAPLWMGFVRFIFVGIRECFCDIIMHTWVGFFLENSIG